MKTDIFLGKNEIKQTDIVIIHPQTDYINNRPSRLSSERKRYIIPLL